MLVLLIQALGVVTCVLVLGAIALHDVWARLRHNWTRPTSRLLDTVYALFEGHRLGRHDVVELSTGKVDMAWDILETVGMPDRIPLPRSEINAFLTGLRFQ